MRKKGSGWVTSNVPLGAEQEAIYWKAKYEAERERAAKVAEKMGLGSGEFGTKMSIRIAAAIREAGRE